MENPLRLLPSIKQIQDSVVYQKWKDSSEISEAYLTTIAKEVVERERQRLLQNETKSVTYDKKELFLHIVSRFDLSVHQLLAPILTNVINGTGIILHTNLGRARLASDFVDSIGQVASNYTDLEFDIEEGKRASRYDKVERLLTLITGAEAAMIVNNNAAAVFLILRAFAKQKDVIVSRGELVEIGGSFRVSSIMTESDANLIEVGTTNKTRIKDYMNAITEKTALLMKVHQSNFMMVGFTESASREELTDLAAKRHLIFYEDLGSGAFFNYQKMGVGNEPIISDILREGVDIVSASGDKLFGGPQAGIILGKKNLIVQLKQHQLTRTFRVDKLTLAGLSKTLQHYLSEKHVEELPTIHDITQPIGNIKRRAQYLNGLLSRCYGVTSTLTRTHAFVGGGTMPGVTLDSFGLCVEVQGMAAHDLAHSLRTGVPSVIGRIEDEKFIIDCRTITDEETKIIYNAFQENLDLNHGHK